MRSISIFVFLFFLESAGFSQESQVSRGQLNVNQDERLEELVRRHIEINENSNGIPGYRIRIFSQSGQDARSRAQNVTARFFESYPNVNTYMVWDPPNWKVYVGDFRTRSEALKLQRRINRAYPYSFIISDRINLPPID
jgi:hypothetical protein